MWGLGRPYRAYDRPLGLAGGREERNDFAQLIDLGFDPLKLRTGDRRLGRGRNLGSGAELADQALHFAQVKPILVAVAAVLGDGTVGELSSVDQAYDLRLAGVEDLTCCVEADKDVFHNP